MLAVQPTSAAMDIGGPSYVFHLVSQYFFDGKSRQQAFESLQFSHIRNPYIFYPIDVSTIHVYYTLLENGIYNIVPTQAPPPPVQIHQPTEYQWINYPAMAGFNYDPYPMPPQQFFVPPPQQPTMPFWQQLPPRVPSPLPQLDGWHNFPMYPQMSPDGQSSETDSPSPGIESPPPEFWLPLLPLQMPQDFLSPDEQQPPRPTLNTIPVFDHVIHKLNGRDQRSLRRVCQLFRWLIEKDDRLFKTIRIVFTGFSVVIFEKSGLNGAENRTIFTQSAYATTDSGHNLEEEQETPPERKFIIAAIANFVEKVGKMYTKIEKFIVKQHKRTIDSDDSVFFFEKLVQALEARDSKLEIEQLNITSSAANLFDGIMGQCLPGNLTRIEFTLMQNNERNKVFGDFQNFEQHRNHLSRLNVDGSMCSLSILSASSIKSFQATMRQPTLEEVREYKEIIRAKTSFFLHFFSFDVNADNFINHLNPEIIIPDDEEVDEDDAQPPTCIIPLNTTTIGSIMVKKICLKSVSVSFLHKMF